MDSSSNSSRSGCGGGGDSVHSGNGDVLGGGICNGCGNGGGDDGAGRGIGVLYGRDDGNGCAW